MTRTSKASNTTEKGYEQLLQELAIRRQRVYDYLLNHEYVQRLSPAHIHDGALSYLKMGGKSLRPAVMLLSCGAVGGDEHIAIPAAAGIEVYHTWTLVHDDIIDRDDRRRGKPTVHVEFAQRGAQELGFNGEDAQHYGRVIGILAGDVQQSWSYMLFHDLFFRHGVDPVLVMALVRELATDVQLLLVEGETLDVQYTRQEVLSLTEEQVIEMLRKKTGVLYAFAGRAGAMIGLADSTGNAPEIRYISRFCDLCGTAFQLQDDVLGIVGDPAKTGKPVGADLREGKKTLIVFRALNTADEPDKRVLLSVLGNHTASDESVQEATRLLHDLGAVDYTRQIAHQMVSEGLAELGHLASSPYRDLLQMWAEYMIERRL